MCQVKFLKNCAVYVLDVTDSNNPLSVITSSQRCAHGSFPVRRPTAPPRSETVLCVNVLRSKASIQIVEALIVASLQCLFSGYGSWKIRAQRL